MKIEVECREKKVKIERLMEDHICKLGLKLDTNKMEKYDFNTSLMLIFLIKEHEKKNKKPNPNKKQRKKRPDAPDNRVYDNKKLGFEKMETNEPKPKEEQKIEENKPDEEIE